MPRRRRNSKWGALPTNLSDLPSWEWILPSVEEAQVEPLLNEIVSALVLGNVGKVATNETYLQTGQKYHCKALKRLKARMENRQACLSDSTLAAVMLFGIYEVSGLMPTSYYVLK